jgi:chromosome segregation ATPase
VRAVLCAQAAASKNGKITNSSFETTKTMDGTNETMNSNQEVASLSPSSDEGSLLKSSPLVVSAKNKSIDSSAAKTTGRSDAAPCLFAASLAPDLVNACSVVTSKARSTSKRTHIAAALLLVVLATLMDSGGRARARAGLAEAKLAAVDEKRNAAVLEATQLVGKVSHLEGALATLMVSGGRARARAGLAEAKLAAVDEERNAAVLEATQLAGKVSHLEGAIADKLDAAETGRKAVAEEAIQLAANVSYLKATLAAVDEERNAVAEEAIQLAANLSYLKATLAAVEADRDAVAEEAAANLSYLKATLAAVETDRDAVVEEVTQVVAILKATLAANMRT